jgi:hypothetical protein
VISRNRWAMHKKALSLPSAYLYLIEDLTEKQCQVGPADSGGRGGANFPADIVRMRKRDHFEYFARQDSSTCDTIGMILFGFGKILESHRAISRSAFGETSLEEHPGCRDG